MIKTKNISISYKEFENFEDLNGGDRELISAARLSAENAYAPYSKFSVGAAIRLESGKIVCGANIENAAFPSGICAERSALANSITNYKNDKPVEIAIAAMTKDGFTEDPVTPCGNCRQVIAEEEARTGKSIRIILSGKSKTMVIDNIGCLLPFQFNNKNLKVNLP
jgi:cytidine deaminase